MINEFLAKHNISRYRLAQLLEIPGNSMKRWAKEGPQHPELMRRALRDLAKELEKS